MLKKTISYVDYNGTPRKEDFFFNLTNAELVKMEASSTGGMKRFVDRIMEAQDTKSMIEIFEDLVLRAYGEKSLDGKHFLKVDDNGHRLANKFAQTEAYSILFMELASDDHAAAEFINGIVPQAVAEALAANPALTTPEA